MRDIYIDKWAKTLIHFSLEAKPRQTAVLSGDIAALPLIEACYEQLMKVGVFVEVFISPKYFSEIQLKYASDEVIEKTAPGFLHALENADLCILIDSDSNTKMLMNVDPDKLALSSKSMEPLIKALMDRAAEKKMRWVYTHYPTPAAAQESDMGTLEYRDFIYSLCYLNDPDPIKQWAIIEEKQQKLIDYLETKHELHFKNKVGTDLKVNISGMKWVNCCGKINFPDGEVYTGPNLKAKDGGVNGIVRYSFPVIYRYVEVQDIELVFENGAVVQANASKGQDFLRKVISQDEGARFVGEIAIGTNPNMNRITKNILFDEKFGGTFHLALGRGYPQTGNTNQSAHHWDITFDLRDGGTIMADGDLVLEDGKFIPELNFDLLKI